VGRVKPGGMGKAPGEGGKKGVGLKGIRGRAVLQQKALGFGVVR